MLQLFHMDVAFVRIVSSFPDVCCKRFDLDVAYIFTHMLQQRVLKYFICFNLPMCASISLAKEPLLAYDAYTRHGWMDGWMDEAMHIHAASCHTLDFAMIPARRRPYLGS
jgi:hypothetical protein